MTFYCASCIADLALVREAVTTVAGTACCMAHAVLLAHSSDDPGRRRQRLDALRDLAAGKAETADPSEQVKLELLVQEYGLAGAMDMGGPARRPGRQGAAGSGHGGPGHGGPGPGPGGGAAGEERRSRRGRGRGRPGERPVGEAGDGRRDQRPGTEQGGVAPRGAGSDAAPPVDASEGAAPTQTPAPAGVSAGNASQAAAPATAVPVPPSVPPTPEPDA